MGDWSSETAMAMERRHGLEGEQRIARQETLLRQMTERGHDHLIGEATEVLRLLREMVDFSRARLRDLEARVRGEFRTPVADDRISSQAGAPDPKTPLCHDLKSVARLSSTI